MRTTLKIVAGVIAMACLSAPYAAAQTGDQRPASTVGSIAVDTVRRAATGAAVANPVGAAARIILTPSSTATPAQDQCGGPNYNCSLPAPGAGQALPPPPQQPAPPIAQSSSGSSSSGEES